MFTILKLHLSLELANEPANNSDNNWHKKTSRYTTGLSNELIVMHFSFSSNRKKYRLYYRSYLYNHYEHSSQPLVNHRCLSGAQVIGNYR